MLLTVIPEDFEFSPEERESGDGDSGGESREATEQPPLEVILEEDESLSKKKTKRVVSKIPVRQIKLSGVKHNDEVKSDLIAASICPNETAQQAAACPENSIGELEDNGINADLAPDTIEQSEQMEERKPDLKDIFKDLAKGDELNGEIEPRALQCAPNELEETILEAPEEFRSLQLQQQRLSGGVEENLPAVGDLVGPDDDNEDTQESVLDNDPMGLRASDVGDGVHGAPGGVAGDVCAPPPLAEASIESGVAHCAQPLGCSRVSAAEVCAGAPAPPQPPDCGQLATPSGGEDPLERSALAWTFRNGRLVFEPAPDLTRTKDLDSHAEAGHEQVVAPEDDNPISSKDLNKRIDDNRSRLKYLEQKLKQAGITDESPKLDSNHNILLEPSTFCQFDVRNLNSQHPPDAFHLEVYDELDEEDEDLTTLTTNMGTDSDKPNKHNPDRDNLKSLLKKPGGRPQRKSNRVIFNENKNEFFDADYIILIREECDYDDEDDDGVCTCNQHEMVRLTCCEPNCNCSVYDGYDQNTPQSPKFAPPIEFVDAVTLSPPEGYKDMELGEQELYALQQMARRGQQQRTAVCRECSATHEEEEEDEGEGCQSDSEVAAGPPEDPEGPQEEKEKTDQSQQTTPTTPPNDEGNPNYILETITMTTVTEQRILRDAEDDRKTSSPTVLPPAGGSPISGILKGGRLWKQQSLECSNPRPAEPQQQQQQQASLTDSSITSDEESGSRRSVRFYETDPNNKRDICDGAPDNLHEELPDKPPNEPPPKPPIESSTSPESTEMMLTFKLGNHVLISNNSLKPNSAVRQLFPCTKPLGSNPKPEDESVQQYLVTAESLRAFEEAKRAKLPQIIQSGETDESIKRAIERNTLRRSLIRYEPRSKKTTKTDNSLVERIKQLTCDVDQEIPSHEDPTLDTTRASPPGEEARNSPEISAIKSFSPSSSSTASSNSSSVSSTYKKITDLFGKRDKLPDIQNNFEAKVGTLPDIGGPPQSHDLNDPKLGLNDSRRQFLSTLAPLTACVSGMGVTTDEYYYHLSNSQVGERVSVASSVGTEYSLEDIDEGLKTGGEEDGKRIAPDVLAGTPSASESGDELAMFVQQDASRIERIKKKYQPEQLKDEDDEHDDYGFNRRPSVRGIKPRFGSTTEILQQIQNQLQPPTQQNVRVAWPYYSETGLTGAVDNTKARTVNQNQMPNYSYANVPEELKARGFVGPQYRPTTLQDDNLYQNCANQRCVREVYRTNVNTYSSMVRVANTNTNGASNEDYQSLQRARNGRPQSPPPLELSKNYHQTMVYIPYNHIEGYRRVQPVPVSCYPPEYYKVSNQNQINKRYIEPIYAHHPYPAHYPNMLPQSMPTPKQMPRPALPNGQPPHVMSSSRSESPLPGQFSTARSTQTPSATMAACHYYPSNARPVGWNIDNSIYVPKMNRHSFPQAAPVRYPSGGDSSSLTDSDSQHSGQMLLPNGYHRPTGDFTTQKDSMPNSPTKPRFIERGVPEGAASVSPQDSAALQNQSSSSTMTSPTSPQNPTPPTGAKPMFYAMNV